MSYFLEIDYLTNILNSKSLPNSYTFTQNLNSLIAKKIKNIKKKLRISF